jgi:hypothetical protein
VSPVWDAVDARARGLGTRLLSREQLENLTRLSTAELSAACRRLGLPLAGDRETATPAELELAVRRWAGAALRTLARWAGPLVPTLAVIYEWRAAGSTGRGSTLRPRPDAVAPRACPRRAGPATDAGGDRGIAPRLA